MAYRNHVKQISRWAQAVAGAIIIAAVFAPYSLHAFGKQEPTAIIVDAETGKPIEGAIALAQWLKVSDKSGRFEMGWMTVKKAKETYADAEGKVYIDDYWGTYVFSQKPSLTVYKPGYFLWHSTNDGTGQTLFNPAQVFTKKDNIVKLCKFETDYSKWLQQHPDIKYPHLEQDHYYNSCINLELPCDGKTIKICDAYYNQESPFMVKEQTESDSIRLNKGKLK